MKGIYYLLVFVIIVACKENSTIREESTPEDEATTIVNAPGSSSEPMQELKNVEDIQKEYSYVTTKIKNSSLDSSSVSYNCHGEKQGTITYFSENGQLRMIKHTYSEYSHFSAVDQYLVKDDTLFFVFYNRLAWSFVNGGQTQDKITESRFYIINNKPVKCLEKNFTVASNAKAPPQSDTVPSEVIECPSLNAIVEKYELLVKYKNRQENLDCLEE